MIGKYSFSLIVIVFFTFSKLVYSQNPTKQQKDRVAKQIEHYQKLLSLTKEQKLEIQPLLLKQAVLVEKIGTLSPDNEEWFETNKKIRSTTAEIDTKLTAEQKAELQLSVNKKFINKKTGKYLNEPIKTQPLDSIQ